MSNSKNNSKHTLVNTHKPAADAPAVAPSGVAAGEKPTSASKAADAATLADGWMARALAAKSSEKLVTAERMAGLNQSFADYQALLDARAGDFKAGAAAKSALAEAEQSVCKALADCVEAGVMGRKEARNWCGERFGFTVSEKTGKPTSRPMAPGDTIAKRVSTLSIAAEYAATGQRPAKGGDSLELVGREALQDKLADYFAGEIGVYAAVARIEAAVKEAKVTIPMEVNPDKIVSLAGKIVSAGEAIAKSAKLREAYTTLLLAVSEIPFPAD